MPEEVEEKEKEEKEEERTVYRIVTWEYWYGCKAVEGHDFIQVFDEVFETREEAEKRLEEIKKFCGDWEIEILTQDEVDEYLREDEEYMERVGEGNWGFPYRNWGVIKENGKEIGVDFY